MKRPITVYDLGGSLYLPATHKNLFSVCVEHKYPHLKSVIIDFEDALDAHRKEEAFGAFQKVLGALPEQKLLIFLRPKNASDVARFMALPSIDRIDGFVLAKCDLAAWQEYALAIPSKNFWLMPVLETPDMLQTSYRIALKEAFLENKEAILALRFGGEDLSVRLGIKRLKNETLYDYPILVHLLHSMVLDFHPFGLTAPVFTYYDDDRGFVKEAVRDLKSGLFGKTLIHPRQADLLNKIYAVDIDTLETAQKLLSHDAPSIMAHAGAMLETVPHRIWAMGILKRAAVYGVA